MTKKKQRIKAAPAAVVLHDRIEVDAAIAQIGEADRARESIQTRMNAALARLKAKFENRAAAHGAVVKTLGQAVRVWCDTNRPMLTENDKHKTVKFGAGDVAWRMTPPKCTIRGEDAVIAALKALDAEKYIRTTESINKQAIIDDPTAVHGVVGITVGQTEEFIITPFAAKLQEAAA